MELLAKQHITLKGHSERVTNYAVALADKFISNDIGEEKEKLLEVVKLAAMLHDIGKVTTSFQSELNNIKEKKELKFRHNEIGWAILQKYMKHPMKDAISSSVYWHHGISNKQNSHTVDEILNGVDENVFLQVLQDFIGDNLIEKNTKLRYIKKSPPYFESSEESDEDINNENLIVRTCVISADRIISGLESSILSEINNKNELSLDEINNTINSNLPYANVYVNNYIEKGDMCMDNPNNKYLSNDRYRKQQEIVELCGQTTIINAPAGFGKTIIGMILSAKSNKQLLWVCPRNSIANSAYDRIVDEITNLGLSGITAELYLTGNVVKSNHKNTDGFNSDIIITNIDNYLKVMVDNANMDKLYTILAADVVFDEYDELISDCALFAGFVNIMQTRHRYTESTTLLLSATYANIEEYWDCIDKKTIILPGKYAHYPAAHNKKYSLTVSDCSQIDLNGNNTLAIVNSISYSQKLHKKFKTNTILAHSEFEDSKKEEIFTKILNLYGKSNNDKGEKLNVIGTHILQTSYDISFRVLYESIISPSATLQRVGRNNRWGEYGDGMAKINIIKLDNKSEKTMVNILYDEKLSDKWYSCISEYNDKEINLDELYAIYNDFHEKYKTDIRNYISKKYRDSFKYLEKIYPIKYNNKSGKTEVIKAGSNKLRYTTTEVFVIAKKYGNKNGYCDAFSVKLYNDSFTDTFKEKQRGKGINDILKVMKSLMKDTRFNYGEIVGNKYKNLPTIEEIQNKYAKKSDTPYIRFDKMYHDEYGFIKMEFFIEES